MKIKILEYQRHKMGKVKVQSHNKCKGKWKKNPNFEIHKKLLENAMMYAVKYQKEYKIEVE